MLEVIIFAILTLGVAGFSAHDKKRMDRYAQKNSGKIRNIALREIDKAGLSVLDFPQYEDALNGDRHLEVKEIIDLIQTCRSKRQRR